METNYAKWLKDLLKRHGITEYVLAQRSGVPQPTINRITRGETKNPKSDTLAQLAIAVGENYGGVVEAKVHAHFPPPVDPRTAEALIASLLQRATPRGGKVLAELAEVAKAGRLQEEDIDVLEALCKRYRNKD